MENIDIDKIAKEVIENTSNMNAEQIKESVLNYQKENIKNTKEEFKKMQEIYKFLENRSFDFLERVIVSSLIMIKYIIKGDEKDV